MVVDTCRGDKETEASEEGKDGRDSCLDSAGQLVRKGLSDVQTATKALVGKGVPS